MARLAMPFFDLVLPALVALGVLAWAWRKRETAPKSSDPARCAGAWAFGIGMVLAHLSIFRELVWPWGDRDPAARDWVPLCIAFTALLATASLFERVRRVVPRGGAPLALALLVLVSMQKALASQGMLGALQALGVFLAGMLTWSALELASERLRGPLPCLVLAFASAGAAAAIGLGGTLAFGRMSGALAALFAAAAVIAARRRVFTLSGGPVAIACIVLVAGWINAWKFAELPLSSAVLSCASFVVPAYAGLGPFATAKPAVRESARFVLAGLLAAASIWIAAGGGPPPAR
jgi:hypothetical protein